MRIKGGEEQSYLSLPDTFLFHFLNKHREQAWKTCLLSLLCFGPIQCYHLPFFIAHIHVSMRTWQAESPPTVSERLQQTVLSVLLESRGMVFAIFQDLFRFTLVQRKLLCLAVHQTGRPTTSLEPFLFSAEKVQLGALYVLSTPAGRPRHERAMTGACRVQQFPRCKFF